MALTSYEDRELMEYYHVVRYQQVTYCFLNQNTVFNGIKNKSARALYGGMEG